MTNVSIIYIMGEYKAHHTRGKDMTQTPDEIVVPSPGDNDPRTSIVITIDGKVVAHVFVGQFSTSVSKAYCTKGVEMEAKEITI